MAADDDDDEVVDYSDAAGFVDLFDTVDAEPDYEKLLTSELLRAQLEAISLRSGGNIGHSSKTTNANMEGGCNGSSISRSQFSDEGLLRMSWVDHGAPCKALIICFASLAVHDAAGIPQVNFEFVGSCKRAGATHGIFVKDLHQAWYLRGTGDTLQSFDALMRTLRREIHHLRPARVVTLGASMGGYAAIRAGVALGAASALAFVPQVFVDPEERDALELPWMAFMGSLRRLHASRLAGGPAGGLELTSLLPCVTSCGHAMEIDVHVGARESGDVREAMLLREAAHVKAEAAVASGGVSIFSRAGAAAGKASGPSAGAASAATGGEAASSAAGCGARVAVHIHPRKGHLFFRELRQSGELVTLLRERHLAPSPSSHLAPSPSSHLAPSISLDYAGAACMQVRGWESRQLSFSLVRSLAACAATVLESDGDERASLLCATEVEEEEGGLALMRPPHMPECERTQLIEYVPRAGSSGSSGSSGGGGGGGGASLQATAKKAALDPTCSAWWGLLEVGLNSLRAIEAAAGIREGLLMGLVDASAFTSRQSALGDGCKWRWVLYGSAPPPRKDSEEEEEEEEEEGALLCAAHTDGGLVTVAPASNRSGLELQRPDGSWQAAGSANCEAVVFGGDVLEAVTNGRYRSVTHRVVAQVLAGQASNNPQCPMPPWQCGPSCLAPLATRRHCTRNHLLTTRCLCVLAPNRLLQRGEGVGKSPEARLAMPYFVRSRRAAIVPLDLLLRFWPSAACAHYFPTPGSSTVADVLAVYSYVKRVGSDALACPPRHAVRFATSTLEPVTSFAAQECTHRSQTSIRQRPIPLHVRHSPLASACARVSMDWLCSQLEGNDWMVLEQRMPRPIGISPSSTHSPGTHSGADAHVADANATASCCRPGESAAGGHLYYCFPFLSNSEQADDASASDLPAEVKAELAGMRELVGSPRDLLHVLSAAEGARYLRCRVATCGDCNATGAESASGKHHSGRPDDVDRCTWRSACGVGEGFLHLVTSADWRASGLAPASVQLFAATLAPRSSIVSPLRALPQALGLNPVKRTGPLLLDSALPTTAPPFQPSAPKLCLYSHTPTCAPKPPSCSHSSHSHACTLCLQTTTRRQCSSASCEAGSVSSSSHQPPTALCCPTRATIPSTAEPR